MKAAIITRPGGPEVLEVQEVPQPEAGLHEVLVRVKASALNRADLLQRMGRYPPPKGVPEKIPGMEFAGEVAELGPGSSRWRIGQRVFGIIGGGAHAEFITTHESTVAEIPNNLPWPQAGAIPEVFMTAHDALRQASFKPGENVLIHAVGSGVGLAASQLVHALGGSAFGTSRTADKIERAQEYGLREGFVASEIASLSELSEFGRRVTSGGFDVVLDLNGGPYFAGSLEAMALKGRIVVIGSVAGTKTEVHLGQILSKRLHVIGTVMRTRSVEEKANVTAAFARDVVPLFTQGKLRPVIDSEFPLAKIQDAHRRLESNQTFGKVVLNIAS